MKTKEELNAIKAEIEALSKKLRALTEDELRQVTGGHNMPPKDENERYVMQTFVIPDGGGQDKQYEHRIYKDLV